VNQRGEIATAVIAVIALAGVAAFIFQPRIFRGDARRADRSAETTAVVEKAVSDAVSAERAKSASAAASVQQIGIAASLSEPSPSSEFIVREVPVAMSLLAPADPTALLAAERRRLAVMEGRLDEARALYSQAYSEIKRLNDLAAKAESERDAAFAAKREADKALAEAAAASRAAAVQRNVVIVALAVLSLGYLALRFQLVGPATLGRIAADIRSGENPIQSLDAHLPPWLHAKVRRQAKLSTDFD
jgi:hypothetical protein